MKCLICNISARWLYLAGALFIALLYSGALYIQYVLHEEPCPLCMIQRFAFIAMLVFFVLGALHNPGRLWTWIYTGLIGLFGLFGIAVASRHIWIQHLPKDQVPACGPGLDFMLDHFPLSKILKELMHGSGECAAKGWNFMGLGIPEWSLLSYVALVALAIFVAWRMRRA
jgi:disulfide bond formation protein DsbB